MKSASTLRIAVLSLTTAIAMGVTTSAYAESFNSIPPAPEYAATLAPTQHEHKYCR